MSKPRARRGARLSIFARVLAVMLGAGVATLGVATAATVRLVRQDREGMLVDRALERTAAMRTEIAHRVALATADLRSVLVASSAGAIPELTSVFADGLVAVRCARNGEEVLTAASDPRAEQLLGAVRESAAPEAAVLDGRFLRVRAAANGVEGDGLVDVAPALRGPSGWRIALAPADAVAARARRATGLANAAVLVRRETDAAGREWIRATAPAVPGAELTVALSTEEERSASLAFSARLVRWSALALVPLLLLAWLLARAVTSPVRALAASVRDPAARVALGALPNDEIGDLGAAMLDATEQLSAEADALHAQVRFSRQVAVVAEPDAVMSALTSAAREAAPAARWGVVDAASIAEGRLPADIDVDLAVLRSALNAAMAATRLRSPDSSRYPSAGRDSITGAARGIVAIARGGVGYGVLVAHAPAQAGERLRHVELFAQSAAGALHNLQLMRDAATQDKLALIGRLAAGVAHEMRNPLAYMLANLRSVEEHSEGETAAAVLEARLGAERLARIVEDLSSMSRGGRELEIAPVELGALVRSTALIAQARRSHVQVQVEMEESNLGALCDRGRTEQIALNLLVNAMDATRRVGSPSVRARLYRDGGSMVLDVSDNGTGIPEATQRALFDAFVSTKGNEGTGLGLYLSRSYARAQRGDVELVATSPEGTTFRLRLPATLGTVRVASSAPLAVVESPPAARRRVLVVDDEAAIIRSLERLLKHDAEVTGALDPTEALELATASEFAVILCDMNMPKMNGREFITALRERDPAKAARVVLVSGSTAAPMDGVLTLTKPVNPDSLRKLLRG